MRIAAACRIIFCIFMLILSKNVLPYLIKFVYLQRIEKAICIYQRQLAVGIELEFVCKITMQRRYWTLRGIMNLRSSGSLGLSPLTASDTLQFTPPHTLLNKAARGLCLAFAAMFAAVCVTSRSDVVRTVLSCLVVRYDKDRRLCAMAAYINKVSRVGIAASYRHFSDRIMFN